MRPDDLLHFVWIADPQISPDGKAVAFTHVSVDREQDAYRTAVWLAAADPVAGNGADARPLSAGPRDSQPRWSPDGSSIVFVRADEAGKPGQLWLLPMSGGEARRLTRLEHGASSPCWSPDGRRIAFASGTNPEKDSPAKPKPKNEPARVVTRPEFRWNNEGFVDWDHLDHVWVLDVAEALAGMAAPPPAEANGAKAGDAGQTPVTETPPSPGAHALTRGDFKELSPSWSRDGKRIRFISDRRPEPWFSLEDSDLYSVSPDLAVATDGAEIQTVVDFPGMIAAYAESADGRIAVVGGHRPEAKSYYKSDLLLFEGSGAKAQARVLTQKWDADFGSDDIAGDQHPPRGGGAKPLAWSADGKHVYGVACRHGAAMLARVDVQSGAVEELTPPDRDVVCGSATQGATRFALTLGGLERPGDLYLYDVGRGELRLLWAPNEALFQERRLGEIEPFWCDGFDGLKLHGWIVKPPDFDATKRYPLILQIHGGPHVAYGFGFFHEFRVLAAAGYVVLYMNPRGSTTYGQEFGNTIQYRYPGDDYRDLMSAVDHVIAKGYIDEQRMGVTGGSGGGLLTNWVIAHTQRFAAAITQRCVSEWMTMWYSSDFAMFMPYWFRKPPYEDPLEYAQRSPITLAAKIETPLMVIHSEEDWRTPINQGEAMFRALLARKKPVVMVRFPGENHELSRSGTPSRRVQNQEHIQRWFDHWLMKKPAPEYRL
jgi:dipeptidyl aminopeptidase/acylaminoacyl peptidase